MADTAAFIHTRSPWKTDLFAHLLSLYPHPYLRCCQWQCCSTASSVLQANLCFQILNSILLCFSGKGKKRDQCKNNQIYPLTETQYCPCNKYNAQPVGNWSDCILPEGGRMEGQLGIKVQGDIKECGQGYRYQAMACYDQDNRIVETSRCNSHGELRWITCCCCFLT